MLVESNLLFSVYQTQANYVYLGIHILISHYHVQINDVGHLNLN